MKPKSEHTCVTVESPSFAVDKTMQAYRQARATLDRIMDAMEGLDTTRMSCATEHSVRRLIDAINAVNDEVNAYFFP